MLEHEVSRKLPLAPGRSTICHHSPVFGSWNFDTAFTRLATIVTSAPRLGWLGAMFSSTSVVAIMNQPSARHHVSGAWPVDLFAHDALFDSSKACLSSPLAGFSRCLYVTMSCLLVSSSAYAFSPTITPYRDRNGSTMNTPSPHSWWARLAPVACQKPPSLVRG